MQKRRQLALVLGALIISGGVSLGQARLGLHVVDSNNRKVGYFGGPSLASGGYGIVSDAIVVIGDESYFIEIARNGFRFTDFLVYTLAPDCSGTPYVPVDPTSRLLQRAWFTTDGFFQYPSVASASQMDLAGLRLLHADGSYGPCNVNPSSGLFSPLLSVSAPTLTPPFRVVDTLPVSPAPPTASFNDVPTSHPFFQYIEALYASGITAGCQAGPPLYCPAAALTRGQMAVFLAKALGL